MTSQTLITRAKSGRAAASPAATTLQVKLFLKTAPNTLAYTSNEVRERTVAKTWYVATFTTLVAAGDYFYLLETVATSAEITTGDCRFAGTDGEEATDIPTTDAVGDATLSNQYEILDRLGYLMAQEIGACSDAGTSAETYAINIDTTTYTIDHTGLDATGNRGTATLTKS
jgi:hypothetical protein